MKINSELIQGSHHFINPLNERQLDLRAKKITAIENLGATLDFFDHIDLGDNDIKKLGNLTLLKRYTTLNLSNNRITKLTDVSDSLPNIENLILMNNRLTDINELYQLKHCKKLKRLILHGNLITQQPDYRYKVIAILPNLKILDFNKVTQSERQKAEESFKPDELTDYMNLINLKDATLDKEHIKKLLENAKTFDQINQLEMLLKQQQVKHLSILNEQ
ncbi:unnamed protein product (macronuclear) [Paramecium tetraurelia]|uniref:U2A'/phosphoprotein 32 family A C-terminal domain-containing protein n=1 Tax=Paramecium tetraurelia TaxID=5888 RepID=A0CLG6_PARTE|nr:uncharacterized protein GSPATT00008181001 [Paramecium tetraurelia]CAK71633.1 unnamed protein product [Paramecium tetraurelia]|eukprot:XP_001439030.1 hypothetical protein (macronuclear) [Paramecium tetraurelia strain d4-2]